MGNRALELRVGIFSLISIGVFIGILYLVNSQFFERSRRVTYRTLVDNAQGIVNLTAVRTGGVLVGQVTAVRLVGEKTEITFSLDSALRIPQGSGIAFRSRGLLGETFLEIIRATDSDVLIPAGGIIPLKTEAVDISELMEVVGLIAHDVKKITGTLSEVMGDGETADGFIQMFEDLKYVTEQTKQMVAENKQRIGETLDNLHQISVNLSVITEENPLSGLDKLTDDVSAVLDDVSATVDGVNTVVNTVKSGEGTIGRLIQDDELIEDISQISKDVKGLVGGSSSLNLDFRYQNEFRADSSVQNYFQALVHFGKSRSYRFGIVSYPTSENEQRVAIREVADDGSETRSEQTIINKEPSYRLSAQIAQRWKWLAFRFGLFEGQGGFGVDSYFLKDRVRFSAEAFDFDKNSRDRMLARLKFFSSVYITEHLFFTGGFSDATRLVGDEAIWQIALPFVGGGFQFTDYDAKNILTLIP